MAYKHIAFPFFFFFLILLRLLHRKKKRKRFFEEIRQDGTDRLTACNNFVYWGARGERGRAPPCVLTCCTEPEGS